MLPRLRATLDFMPSPIEGKPGLLIRDPFRFSGATLIVPPGLIECLTFFDGEKTALDLRAHLVELTGELDVSSLQQHLEDALSQAGFLEDESFERRRRETELAFREAPTRAATHAGGGYPEEPAELNTCFAGYMTAASGEPQPDPGGRTVAIAAPHVSPFGGVEAYRAAYRCLGPQDAERTFVVLGTSHYGRPNRLGLTRKSFTTPLGETRTDLKLVDEIERGSGDPMMEDYCHAIEHSIEFQVVFLQYLFGPAIRVVPVLCGSFGYSLRDGKWPEDDEGVRRTLGTLGEIAAREGDRLLWVLGVDMAHMGRRYGDSFEAVAGQREMQDVSQRDAARIQRMEHGDARGFWELVRENGDDLKWCGSAPIYTFLKAVPQARGSLIHYQQWNIDPASVVTFAGLRFR
jgi:AmmeMemoRadiSam system protein B